MFFPKQKPFVICRKLGELLLGKPQSACNLFVLPCFFLLFPFSVFPRKILKKLIDSTKHGYIGNVTAKVQSSYRVTTSKKNLCHKKVILFRFTRKWTWEWAWKLRFPQVFFVSFHTWNSSKLKEFLIPNCKPTTKACEALSRTFSMSPVIHSVRHEGHDTLV